MMEMEWYVVHPNITNPINFRFKSKVGERNVFLFNVSLEVFVLILLIIIYISIVVCSVLRRKQSSQKESIEEKTLKKRENRLTAVAAVLSISIAIFASSSVCILLLVTQAAPQWLLKYLFAPQYLFFRYLMVYIVPFADFIFNFSNPYILLIMSPMIRRSCLETLHIDQYFYDKGSKSLSIVTQVSTTKENNTKL